LNALAKKKKNNDVFTKLPLCHDCPCVMSECIPNAPIL